ncbi:MAG: hypothetical protein M3P30_13920 [Chloroflexota bacterium]|nr:hypothetical protein [Chloroflexota bacterium]
MTVEQAEKTRRRPALIGCFARLLVVAVVLVALVVAIGFAFDQGDEATQPQQGFDAGRAADYQRATVSQLEAQHVFITRLQNGDFIALYDLSPRQQELGGDCRLIYEDTAGVGTLDQLPGITGGIVEDCNNSRAVWRADGTYAFGVGYGNLDRFRTSIDADGNLIVDTGSRTCTRSRGVIGVAPFDLRTCEGAP